MSVFDSVQTGASRRVPVVLQHERAECGLACLAMIAGFFGQTTSLDRLRQSARLSGHGATFQELVGVAQELNLIARPVRLSLGEMKKLRLPAVLHWRMNHFVVLTSVGRRKCSIHDPVTGKRDVDYNELDESFTGVALEFVPAQNFVFGDKKPRPGLLQSMGRIGRLYRYLGLMLFLLFVSQLLALIPAIATQVLIDEVVLGQDRQWLYRSLGGLALIMSAAILLDGIRGWVGLYAGTRLAADSTVRVLDHLFRLPVEFVRRRHLGDLMSKLDSLTPIREAITTHGVSAIVQCVVLLTTIVVMFLYSPWLTAVSVAGLVLTLLLTLFLMPVSRRLNQQLLIHRASQNTSLVETLRAYDTVRGLGLGNVRRLHWQRSFLAATAVSVTEGKYAIGRNLATGVISMSDQLLFLAVGITGILDKELTLGVLFAFFGLRGRLASAAVTLVDLAQRFSLLRVHTDRVLDILHGEPEAEQPAGAIRTTLIGKLQARRLTFAYAQDAHVVRDFSCEITPGANTVITGPSGCGKTTLLRLLAGQLAPGSGIVLIDGEERGLWDEKVLIQQSAFVLQNDQLFQGTITENISAFCAAPDLRRVRKAALQAECWSDIQALPMRTESLIGDTGVGLSGGQIQRLTLARALYRQPRLLFLDEATSHLDVATEKRVLRNIAGLGVTVVSVAHRPDAIALADQIIQLGVASDQ